MWSPRSLEGFAEASIYSRTLVTMQHHNGIDEAGSAAGNYILQAGGLRWRFVKE